MDLSKNMYPSSPKSQCSSIIYPAIKLDKPYSRSRGGQLVTWDSILGIYKWPCFASK